MDSRTYLKELFLQGLEECSPSNALAKAVTFDGEVLSIDSEDIEVRDRPIYLFSVGKASVPMFEAVHGMIGRQLADSLVITPEEKKAGGCKADNVLVAAHPTPDESSRRAGEQAVNFIKRIPEEALLITLISGGTSSLMCLPAGDISIGDLKRTFELLNKSGADIREINTVRKHCSEVKGGQLLRYLKSDTTLVDLVISDVPDNDLSVIGSGPTTPDSSTFTEAYHILLEYALWEKVPETVRRHIEEGMEGRVAETVKPAEDPLDHHYSHIVSSARKMALTISDLAFCRNHNSWMMDEAFKEDVGEVADQISGRILPYADRLSPGSDTDPSLFVYYGESTVSVSGGGKGGRNQELALRGALKIAGHENISWLSADTDGIDGPTDVAGAIVDGRTIPTAREQGIDPQEFLDNNDSYHFHEKMGSLLKTGPTGNNLMDVVLVLVGEVE
jgi:glycerate-2-kinase